VTAVTPLEWVATGGAVVSAIVVVVMSVRIRRAPPGAFSTGPIRTLLACAAATNLAIFLADVSWTKAANLTMAVGLALSAAYYRRILAAIRGNDRR